MADLYKSMGKAIVIILDTGGSIRNLCFGECFCVKSKAAGVRGLSGKLSCTQTDFVLC